MRSLHSCIGCLLAISSWAAHRGCICIPSGDITLAILRCFFGRDEHRDLVQSCLIYFSYSCNFYKLERAEVGLEEPDAYVGMWGESFRSIARRMHESTPASFENTNVYPEVFFSSPPKLPTLLLLRGG
ncbi:hypothetical protein M011DRAFT_4544 [Sporormia fimetaria CBS 119925]|uniref:Secreted protein n=1 Tax=Sporormia fimetaria CBS 119925 TaxID=1340428 RepID=A0A6A6VR58_9PLEO|nr:hypothetical protein M011DRAFT_4544 [Sporormia fimetaria CBS 119925]